MLLRKRGPLGPNSIKGRDTLLIFFLPVQKKVGGKMSDSVDYSARLALLLHLNFLSEPPKKVQTRRLSGSLSLFVLLTNWHPEALVISILGAVCYFRSAGWKETRRRRRRKSLRDLDEWTAGCWPGSLIFLMLFLLLFYFCVRDE